MVYGMQVNNLPFFMKGITATHPGINYKGNDEFVINTPVYPGSSGSPVFRLTEAFYCKSRNFEAGPDHVRLLGIARKRLYVTKNGEVVTRTIDLGVAIRSTKLRDFESIMANSLEWDV